MSPSPSTLHLLCGKIASGKSTFAAALSREENAVLISEDAWLGPLFADQIATGADFMRCSGRLRGVMGPHVAQLLAAGVSVVLDFAANTVETRNWMRGILEQTEAAHQLHVFDVSDEICLARLKQRNARGEHPFTVSEQQFHAFTQYLVLPTPDEGFTIVTHGELGISHGQVG